MQHCNDFLREVGSLSSNPSDLYKRADNDSKASKAIKTRRTIEQLGTALQLGAEKEGSEEFSIVERMKVSTN